MHVSKQADIFHQTGVSMLDKVQTHSFFFFGGDQARDVRRWLDQAPSKAASNGMQIWGELLASIVCNIGQGLEEDPRDAARIGQYFDAMASLYPSQWWWKGPQDQQDGCAHEPFHRICCTLLPTKNEVSHFLDVLVRQQQWDPTNLLVALETAVRTNRHWVHACDGTSLSTLLKGLGTLPTDAWKPQNNPAHGPFWLAPTIHFTYGTSHTKELAQENPALTPYMLLAMHRAEHVAHYDMESVFPLAMETCDENKLAHALLMLMTEKAKDGRSAKSIGFEHLLVQHHPHVAQLLGMHLNLFPDACPQCTYSDILAPGLGALFGRGAAAEERISSDAFSDLVW